MKTQDKHRTNKRETRRAMYLYRDLTEKLIGMCYEVYRSIGYGQKEKTYQKVLELEIKNSNTVYKRELYGKIEYKGE